MFSVIFKIALSILLVSFILTQHSYSKEEYITTNHGSFKIIDKNSNVVVTAPHGTYDINTGVITDQVCKRLDVNCIISKGFVPNGTRLNVNRPTEGVGKKPNNEPVTSRAKKTYKQYLNAIIKVSNNKLKWYFEIHGSRSKVIEVALHNINLDEAKSIKTILEQEWSSHSNYKISINVQGIDKIRLKGTAVKKFGVVNELQPKFIQFEFPRKLRENKNLLANFLVTSINRIKLEL